ncbi:YlaC family protein [Entomohabitans teleogrylli]|uniref:YlaC family protein n=1 Tax=Entomohabitans teleogrylli TaxID=1384589 RepID=UPI00073D5049|nr:YlaC family protein [Entomohabitans teleogrylli]
MTEIQRLLTNALDQINRDERRDNRPRFSISFLRKHPWLFLTMYLGWFATLAVMLLSTTLAGSVWLLIILFILMNGFFFFDVSPRYRYEDIDVLDLRVCYNGEWYNTRYAPVSLIDNILNSTRVEEVQKAALRNMLARKGNLSFYDIFSLDKAISAAQPLSVGRDVAQTL